MSPTAKAELGSCRSGLKIEMLSSVHIVVPHMACQVLSFVQSLVSESRLTFILNREVTN